MDTTALWAEIEGQLYASLDSIGGHVVQLFKQAIQEKVYDYYSPIPEEKGGYKRTMAFIDSVTFEYIWEEDSLFVYTDITSNTYSSRYGDKGDVSEYVATWLEHGHSDGIGVVRDGENQFHEYEGRSYLERAYELISKAYPFLYVEIVDEVAEY